MRFPARRGAAAAITAGVLATACAPDLDWRDARPAGTALVMQFPCRPVLQERDLTLGARPVRLALLACTAGGQTWALAHGDLVDPQRVVSALVELREGAAAKVGAAAGEPAALAVPGATPNAGAGRLRLEGRGAADRPARQMELALFVHGTRVFQASVLGPRVGGDAADTFFAALRFEPR